MNLRYTIRLQLSHLGHLPKLRDPFRARGTSKIPCWVTGVTEVIGFRFSSRNRAHICNFGSLLIFCVPTFQAVFNGQDHWRYLRRLLFPLSFCLQK